MKVVILCGGKGTRLREETEFKPKPMVDVGGRPILWHIMKTYAHHGFSDFVLCLGYKGDHIKNYFLNYQAENADFTVTLGKQEVQFHDSTHRESGWRVTCADTGQDTLTGGRVKRVKKYLEGERFFLTYGDGVCDVDIDALLKFHKAHGKLATVTGVRPPGRFGELGLVGDRVETFAEKPEAASSFINGGYFIFEPGVMDYLSDDESCMLERAPIEKLAADGQLMVYRHENFWQCVDTYRDLTLINQLWDSGNAPWKVW